MASSVRWATRTALSQDKPGRWIAYCRGGGHPTSITAASASHRITGIWYIGVTVIVYTLGHSTLAFDAFRSLLERHGIAGVVDVRRFPRSRRHPQFASEALAAGLGAGGIAYDWLPELGGRRPAKRGSPHVGWRVEAFRGYADHMESDEFASGLTRLLTLAALRTSAIMCAEAVPWRCHRRLIADALLARTVDVRHVMGATAEPHELTSFARLEGDRIVYDRTTTPLLPGV
jgi:hypothetical protein